jgi:hypothetical protein
VSTIANVPLYQTCQGVFQTEFKVLLFNLVDMHRLSPKIEEAMKFQNGISVVRNLEKVNTTKNMLVHDDPILS